MTLEWVEAKQAEYNKKYEGYPDVILNMYYSLDEDVKAMIRPTIEDNIKHYNALRALKEVSPESLTDEMDSDMKWIFNKMSLAAHFSKDILEIDIKRKEQVDKEELIKCRDFLDKFEEACEDYFNYALTNGCHYYRFLDSEVLNYNGEDIIITDPCYLAADDEEVEDFESYEEKFENAWEDGTFNGAQSSTIYGDWSCTTWDMNTKEPLGEFCADGGMVCVVDLDGAKKLNPNFDWHETKPWTTTIIRNFKGTAQIKIKEEKCVYEEDYEGHWKKGDEYIEYVCYVEGHGVNSETGEPIDFITSQTGL